MNIIEEVKKMDKVPVELIETIATKIGESSAWREEGERRGICILIMDEERTRNAFSGSTAHLIRAFMSMKSSLEENPVAQSILEMKELLNGLAKDMDAEELN